MKKSIVLLSFLFSLMVFGQENNQSKHHIGGHLGSVSGMGFSYRYWPTKLGGQITFVPVFKKDGGYLISSGISALYTLKQSQFVDLYAYWGFHLINTKSTFNIYDPYDPSIIILQQNTYKNYYNTGLGVGFKFKLLDNLDFCLQGGYGVYMSEDNFINQLFYKTNIAGGIGLYYKL